MRRLLSLFGGAGAYVLIGRIVQFGLFYTLAHATTVDTMGLFLTCLTAGQLLANLSTFGLGAASQRIIPNAMARNRPRLVSAFLRGFLVAFVIMTGGMVLVILLAKFLAARLGYDFPEPLALGLAFFIPVFSISSSRELVSRAFGSIGMAFAPRDIVWSAMLSVLTLLLRPSGLQVVWLGGISLLLVEAIAGVILYKKHLATLALSRSPGTGFRRQWLRDGLAFMTSSLGGQGFERIDTLYVASSLSLHAAGIYGLCSRLAPVASICQRFIVPVTLHKFSLAFARKDLASVYSALWSGVLAAALFAGPLVLGVMLFAHILLGSFGPMYKEGAGVLMVLVFAHASIAIGSNFGALILSSRRPGLYGTVILVLLLLTMISLAILQPINLTSIAMIVAGGIIFYNVALILLGLKYCIPTD